MNFLYKLERKYGKYAIKNMPVVMTVIIAIGYFLVMFAPAATLKCIFIPTEVILHHEYWRLFTWIFTPAGEVNFVSVLMLIFLIMFGRLIEAGMGTFLFNLYILGIWFWNTLIMMTVSVYGYLHFGADEFVIFGYMQTSSMVMYLFDFGIFLAFALLYADTRVNFMLIIPVKTSWIAMLDLIFMAYYFINGTFMDRANIVAYILNLVVFFMLMAKSKKMRDTRSKSGQITMGRKTRWQEHQRQGERSLNDKKIKQMSAPKGVRHKCSICGKSEEDDSTLEFRFCSKCKGNHEYCNEHLFTHEHIK